MIGKLFQWYLILCFLLTDGVAIETEEVHDGVATKTEEVHGKTMEERLKRLHIPKDLSTKISSGDRTAFKTMDRSVIRKLTPDIIADVGKEAIKELDVTQVKTMAKNFYKGNEEHLEKIFSALDKDQLDGVVDSIQETRANSSEREQLNCIQFEPLIDALKRTSGNPSEWNKEVFDKLGGDFVQCLPPSDLKEAAGNKEVFKSVLKNVKNIRGKHKRISKVERKSLLQGATKAFGKMKDWRMDDLKSASSLVTMMKPKDLKELDTTAVKGAIDDLGRQEWEEKRGKEVLAKLKDPSKGYGNINSWTPDVVKKLGNLRGSLSKKELNELSGDTLRQSVREFGRTSLPPYKKRALGKRLKNLYGNPRNWTKDHIRNASNILGGMGIDDLEEMDDAALLEALPDVKSIKLPRHKGRVLAKKIQKQMGSVMNWTLDAVRKIGPLMKDLPMTMLKNLKPDEAREAVKMLRTSRDVPMSKRRVLIKQALMSGGNTSKLPIKEFGEFVAEFPLTELKKVQSVGDLLPESAGNDSMDAEAMWNPSQARTLVEDVVTNVNNWGPIEQHSDNWGIENIKKLGRLALGLSKSNLDELDDLSFPDFAAEFSQISNWTNGQAKKIASRFMKSFEDRESEITVTDIASLGDLLIDVADPIIKKLSKETAREAVRIMGTSQELRKLPKILKQKKVKTALELLEKDIPDLTADELDDLGYLISGFESDDIEEINSTALVDAIITIGEVDDLEVEAIVALVTKVVDVYGDASALDGEILQDMGKIVEGLSSHDVNRIPDAVVVENVHVFAEASLRQDVAKAVVETIESFRRKRREISNMYFKTGAEVVEMGSTLSALTSDEIASISNEAFSNAVAEISQIKGFTTAQLQAWANKVKSAWGSDVSNYTEDQLLQLNEFAKGFSGTELKNMPIDSNEVIESFGTVSGYSQDQITRLSETIKTAKPIQEFSGDDLMSWGVIALGLTSTEIGQISTQAYENAALELGDVQGWSTDQMKGLKSKAVATFGKVSTWSAAQVSLAGAAIGGFTAEEIQTIDSDQLDAIKPSALQQIPAEVFKEFSVEQLTDLSPEQAASVTDSQTAALSSEQKDILLKVQTDTVGYTSGSYPTKWSSSLIASALIVLFCQLL